MAGPPAQNRSSPRDFPISVAPGGESGAKGADPRELVLSCDWERWQRQTASYFAGFDIAQLPVGSGREVSSADDVSVAADSPMDQAIDRRVVALGLRPRMSFDTDFETHLPRSRGKFPVATCVGDRMLPPADRFEAFLALPMAEARSRIAGGESGVARRRLDDGTRVVLLDAPDVAGLLKLVETLELQPPRDEDGR